MAEITRIYVPVGFAGEFRSNPVYSSNDFEFRDLDGLTYSGNITISFYSSYVSFITVEIPGQFAHNWKVQHVKGRELRGFNEILEGGKYKAVYAISKGVRNYVGSINDAQRTLFDIVLVVDPIYK